MSFFSRLFSRRAAPGNYRAHEPAPLFEHELNPAPEGMKASSLWTEDGVRIRYATARTTQPYCRGTVVIFIGRNECIEKYHETSADMMASGFDIVVFDWRGQGDSQHMLKDRQKGYVRRFSDYGRDVEAVFRQVVLPDARAPFFVVAHSLGGRCP
jgi:lysophospholipase